MTTDQLATVALRRTAIAALAAACATALAVPAPASANVTCGKSRDYTKSAKLIVKGYWRAGAHQHRRETFNAAREVFCTRTAKATTYTRPGTTFHLYDPYGPTPAITTSVHCWDVTGTYDAPCKPGQYGHYEARLTVRWINRYQDKCVTHLATSSYAWADTVPTRRVDQVCSFQPRYLGAHR